MPEEEGQAELLGLREPVGEGVRLLWMEPPGLTEPERLPEVLTVGQALLEGV